MGNNMYKIAAWIACGVAATVGVIVTDNSLCLLALLIPVLL